MANYQSAYTGAQIDTAIEKINNLEIPDVPTDNEISVLAEAAFKNCAVLTSSLSANGITYRLYKYGRVGWITTVATGTTTSATSTNYTVLTIPEIFRPITRVEIMNSCNAAHRACLHPEGNLELVSAVPAGTYFRLSAAYITAS